MRIPRISLPAGIRVDQHTSETGDVCHYNLSALTKGECRALLKASKPLEYEICDVDGHRPITLNELHVFGEAA